MTKVTCLLGPPTCKLHDVEQGWGLPNQSRKWHFFVDATSLCGKFGFYFGPLQHGNDGSEDNCAPCKRAFQSTQ